LTIAEQNATHEPPPRAAFSTATGLSNAGFGASTHLRRRSVISAFCEMKTAILGQSLLGGICFALIGCESPPVYIPPTVGTWTGHAFEVRLVGDKHPIHDRPKDARPDQVRVMQRDNGEAISWFYLIPAVTLEWGRQLTTKPPMSRADYEPGQIGHTDAMVVLADSSGYPLDPAQYRDRRLRVSGKLMAGQPRCSRDQGHLRAHYDPVLPFSVMMWTLSTSPGHIEDLGPVAPGSESYFPRSIMYPEHIIEVR